MNKIYSMFSCLKQFLVEKKKNKSFVNYKKFSKSVRTKSRYIFDDESNAVLNMIKNNHKCKVEIIAKNEIFWRSQIGCDFDRVYQDGEHVDDTEIPYSSLRMKPLQESRSEGRLNPKIESLRNNIILILFVIKVNKI